MAPVSRGARPASSLRALLLLLVGTAMGGGLGYAYAKPSADRAQAAADVARPCLESTPKVLTATAPSAVLAAPTAGIAETPTAERSQSTEIEHRRAQSRALVGALGFQVARAKLAPHATSPEAIASEVDVYLAGWTDALMRAAPELVDELAAEIEHSMCKAGAEEGYLVVLTNAVARMPELANTRGLECILARDKEDFVTWRALDAWSASRAPFDDSEIFARVARNARDERTLHRLQAIRSPEEYRADMQRRAAER